MLDPISHKILVYDGGREGWRTPNNIMNATELKHEKHDTVFGKTKFLVQIRYIVRQVGYPDLMPNEYIRISALGEKTLMEQTNKAAASQVQQLTVHNHGTMGDVNQIANMNTNDSEAMRYLEHLFETLLKDQANARAMMQNVTYDKPVEQNSAFIEMAAKFFTPLKDALVDSIKGSVALGGSFLGAAVRTAFNIPQLP
jgi:hypothetical protein